MRIVTERVHESYDRAHAWSAVDDATYDYGGDGQRSPCGYGATEAEAIADLKAQLDDAKEGA